MNALDILQKVFRQAGGPGNNPASILSPTGFTRDCMDWVTTSWRWVQALRQDWWWKWVESTETLTIGQSQYNLSADFHITDARYVKIDDVVIWDSEVGESDQVTLGVREVADWRRKWDFQSHDNQRPTEVAILEDGKLGIGGKADKAYSLRLRYYQQNADFASNTDIPGIPEEYHELIVYRALQLWAGSEQNQIKFRHYEIEVQNWQKLLEADPRIGTGFGNASGTLG